MCSPENLNSKVYESNFRGFKENVEFNYLGLQYEDTGCSVGAPRPPVLTVQNLSNHL